MKFVPQIPVWFSPRKAAQVTAFFAKKAGGSINILRATKLIYLADRLSLDRREHLITGDNLVSMPFGPVNTYTYSYMNGVTNDRIEQWAEFIRPRSKNSVFIRLAKDINISSDLDELSRSDFVILNDIWEAFSSIPDRFDLAEWTHQHCPEWVDPNGSSIPIEFSTVFTKLKKRKPVELANEIQAERAFLALVST